MRQFKRVPCTQKETFDAAADVLVLVWYYVELVLKY